MPPHLLELLKSATALVPIATVSCATARAPSPIATPLAPSAWALVPAASEFKPMAPSFSWLAWIVPPSLTL
ncbi:hypothetical protein DWF00_04230 [Bosea caraganae]|uniref:Uncharacterized protein n=1 Tax=Bosea caraganae TaxID=2763117 RepID=A0A370KXX7_9HYPH|nr:hypothetical protein DWE98_27890 [Bosea caraganae]RDJ30062.1 hypothetical protein DWF00_04230 [Bosea caraganae]